MALDSDYLLTPLREVAAGLTVEHGAGADVRLDAADDGLAVVLDVAGRRLVYSVEDAVYHYEPGDSDPSRHAS